MNCPNCGAALELLDNRDVLTCPYCLTTRFPEVPDDGLVPLEEDDRFDCPRCVVRLKIGAVEGRRVGYCPDCRGFLTTARNFSLVLERRRAKAKAADPKPLTFDPAELTRRTACPRCRSRMDTHPYGGGGNAVIDSCLSCRLVWLDAGELTVLERFVPSKGL
jgi:Zn-finger nucleic acid-binding protein